MLASGDEGRLLARNDRITIPAGNGRVLVQLVVGDGAELLPEPMAALLKRSRGLKHSGHWEQVVCAGLGRPRHLVGRALWRLPWVRQGAAQRVLQQLVEQGLLISGDAILARSASRSRIPEPEAISTICLPTCDRAAPFRRALESYVRHTTQHGRRLAFLVMDDSRRPESVQHNRAAIRDVGGRYGVRISHVGRRERQRFCDSLVRRGGFPREVVEFGAGLHADGSRTAGANRNALLLRTVGRQVLIFDDDTLCRLFARRDCGGVALEAAGQFDQWSFLPDRGSALRHLPEREADIVALHEDVLGRDVRSCFEGRTEGGLASDTLDPALLGQLLNGRPRIAFSMNGLVGDAAIWAPQYLTLEGPSRERLLESEEAYSRAHQSREVTRLPERLTLAASSFCMAYGLGLDNRGLVPPFFPLGRNSDGVLAFALRLCDPDAFAAYLPWALAHVPDGERRFDPAEPWRAATLYRVSDVVMCALASAGPLPGGLEAIDRLGVAGRHLEGIAALPLPDFEAVILAEVRKLLGSRAARLEESLHRWGGRPGYWARDVRRALGGLEQALRQASLVPCDLPAAGSEAEPARQTRALVGLYGRLLQEWPGLQEAARAVWAADEETESREAEL